MTEPKFQIGQKVLYSRLNEKDYDEEDYNPNYNINDCFQYIEKATISDIFYNCDPETLEHTPSGMYEVKFINFYTCPPQEIRVLKHLSEIFTTHQEAKKYFCRIMINFIKEKIGFFNSKIIEFSKIIGDKND